MLRTEQVRAEARALEDRDDLDGLPLAGVPVAVKDNVDLAGMPTRNGSAATSDEPAAADAELVRRLREAGALLVGKTSVPELCLWPFTESEAFGISRNPWSLEHTPGGSSGGSAAAVASAMVPIALAADGGGSIRMPASNCGLLGIKPGPGVVPFPANGVSTWSRMSEFGPLATTVADLGLALDVLAGGGGYRAVASPERPLRVGVSVKPGAVGVKVDPEVLAAVEATAETLAEAGHRVETADPPWHNGDAAPFLRRVFYGCAEDTDRLRWEALEPRTRAEARMGRTLRRARPAPAGPPERVARPLPGLVRGPRPAAQPDPGRATAARRRLPGQGPGPDAARPDRLHAVLPAPQPGRVPGHVGPGRHLGRGPAARGPAGRRPRRRGPAAVGGPPAGDAPPLAPARPDGAGPASS